MRLAKVTFELKYVEKMTMLSGYEAIHRDMLNKEPENVDRWVTPGMRIQDKDKKRSMLVDAMRSAVDVEEPPNEGFARDMVLQFLRSVQERIGIPRIGRHGFLSTWIYEFSGSFEELVNRCKDRVFGCSPLVAPAKDVCAIIDDVTDDLSIHLTIGPMEAQQLRKQFFTFGAESAPDVFLYVSVDIGETKHADYNPQHVRQFFDSALAEGKKRADQIASLVGVDQ